MSKTDRTIEAVAYYHDDALIRYAGETWEKAALRQAREVAYPGTKRDTVADVRGWIFDALESGLGDDVAAASACWEFEVGLQDVDIPDGVPTTYYPPYENQPQAAAYTAGMCALFKARTS